MLEDGFKRLPEADFEGNLLNFKPTPKGLTGSKVNVDKPEKLRFVWQSWMVKSIERSMKDRVRGFSGLYVSPD